MGKSMDSSAAYGSFKNPGMSCMDIYHEIMKMDGELCEGIRYLFMYENSLICM